MATVYVIEQDNNEDYEDHRRWVIGVSLTYYAAASFVKKLAAKEFEAAINHQWQSNRNQAWILSDEGPQKSQYNSNFYEWETEWATPEKVPSYTSKPSFIILKMETV